MSNLNQNSLARALKLNFQTLDNLYLIIGSSNDNRFDEFNGFTVNYGNQIGEEHYQNKTILPLEYDITVKDFFNDINQFKFSRIIFDYNVLNTLFSKGYPDILTLITRLIKLLAINGQLYLPINISYQLKMIYHDNYNFDTINIDHENRTLFDSSVNYFKKKYRYIKNGRSYDDITPYNTYLNNSELFVMSIFNNKPEYNIQFFINSHGYNQDSYPGTISLEFSPYPIQTRIINNNYEKSICEFGVITKTN